MNYCDGDNSSHAKLPKIAARIKKKENKIFWNYNKVNLSILPHAISNSWSSVVIIGMDISKSVVSWYL